MFQDPQSVTINAVANSLPRVSTNGSTSVYQKDDGNVKLTVQHTAGKRVRRVARIDLRKTAPDALFPQQNSPYSMGIQLIVDVPPTGFTITEQKQLADALTGWATASSGANLTKLLGGES